MAKLDFCFTFYDGDATREMAHMNRLERGAYIDVIIQQRQRGHLTKNDLQKFISKDFEAVWPSLEWVLKIDPAGLYFIEWLEISIQKATDFAKIQSGRKLGTSKQKPKLNSDVPNTNRKTDSDNHYKDEDGNGDGNEIKNENFGKSENILLVPEMAKIFYKHNPDYGASKEKDYKPLLSIASYFCEIGKLSGSPDLHSEKILQAWGVTCTVIMADNFYKQKSLSTISNHIQELTQIALHGKSNGKPDYGSKERAKELDRLFAKRYGSGGSATGQDLT